MESNSARYHALPFVSSFFLVLLAYLLSRWEYVVWQQISITFRLTPIMAASILGSILFALLSLLLFTSVFNRRLTPTGSVILLIAGLLVLILPVLALATPLGDTMLLGFLPLSGAFVAAAGFGGLVLEKQLLES